MPYSNSFSRRNPGFLVIMIDQSGSMCATSQNNGLELAENAANSVNNLINELILKLSTVDSTGEEIVKRSINLCLIGYGGPNDEAYYILQDSEHPDGCMWIDEIDANISITRNGQPINRHDVLLPNDVLSINHAITVQLLLAH